MSRKSANSHENPKTGQTLRQHSKKVAINRKDFLAYLTLRTRFYLYIRIYCIPYRYTFREMSYSGEYKNNTDQDIIHIIC